MTNQINLGNHWKQFIQREINSGRYISASEVLRDALRALEERRLLHTTTDFDHPLFPDPNDLCDLEDRLDINHVIFEHSLSKNPNS